MIDFQMLAIISIVIVAVGFVAFILNRNPQVSVAERDTSKSPAYRIKVLAEQRDDLRFYIGVPPERPSRWEVASRVTRDSVEFADREEVSLRAVSAFAVVYPNGQLVDFELNGLPAPKGVTGLASPRRREQPNQLLKLVDLEKGRRFVKVTYGVCKLRPKERDAYSTTLTNISNQRLRILHFGGFQRTKRGYELHNVTGNFYSEEEFQEWYGLKNASWIPPNGTATDPNNYGGRPVLWAYFGETEDGEQFVAGAILD